ncbi:MAG: T9SS type A sorting domain-containing protein [Chlorobi bacterium]|nr:T9SS type A sorting domain-containing protein [Chlorobiota bacterium]
MKTFLTLIFACFLFLFSNGQNVNISEGNVFDGEPYIAVNPQNPEHMVVAWMGWVPYYIAIKTRVSFDGGQTWGNTSYISHTGLADQSADPSMAFDNSGNVFLSYVDYNKALDTGFVYVRKSVDGGLSWGAPVEVINASSDGEHRPIDRPWMSIDSSGGIYDGNIYVTTMPPNIFGPLPPPYHPYFIRSVDGGVSFEPFRYLDTVNWLAGSYVPQPMPVNCISSDGIFYAVYPSYVYSQNPLGQFIIASSEDGGNSFAYNTVFSLSESLSNTLVKTGYLLRSDPSNADHLAFFYLGISYGDYDVLMRESYDKGITWSDAVRLNDDPVGNNKIQDLLWADFDNNGNLVVSWRDRRNGTDTTYTTASEIWGTFRRKDSLNFSQNFRISDTIVPYDTVLASSGNDFMCIKLVNDTLNAVWGDTRDGTLNIWFERKAVGGTVLFTGQLGSEDVPQIEICPNPFTSEIIIKGSTIKQVKIYNQKGQLILLQKKQYQSNLLKIEASELLSGVYYVEIITAEGIVIRKIIKTQKN